MKTKKEGNYDIIEGHFDNYFQQTNYFHILIRSYILLLSFGAEKGTVMGEGPYIDGK